MNNLALLILRIVFAGSMLYGHGLGKLTRLIEGNLSFSNPIGIGEGPTFFLAVFFLDKKGTLKRVHPGPFFAFLNLPNQNPPFSSYYASLF